MRNNERNTDNEKLVKYPNKQITATDRRLSEPTSIKVHYIYIYVHIGYIFYHNNSYLF